MESDGSVVKDYVTSKGGSTIGKVYLARGSNGKPLLYKFDKIVKNSSILYFGALEYGKMVNDREFYISWSKVSSTDKVTHASFAVVTNADARKLLSDIGTSGKIPETPGINAKPLPDYEIKK